MKLYYLYTPCSYLYFGFNFKYHKIVKLERFRSYTFQNERFIFDALPSILHAEEQE